MYCKKVNNKVLFINKNEKGEGMYNRQIQTFVTAAECGSFTKAAAKLFITSASVMKQMNALEERLGIELFKRTSRGIVLTPAGFSVY